MTRAKRHVAVICNVDCISTDPILKSFAEYLTSHGEVRTASQYEHLLAGYDVIRPQGMEFVLKDSSEKKKKNNNKKSQPAKSASKNDKKSRVSPTKDVSKQGTEVPEKVPVKLEEKEKDDLPERREVLVKMVQKFVDSENEKVFRLINLSTHRNYETAFSPVNDVTMGIGEVTFVHGLTLIVKLFAVAIFSAAFSTSIRQSKGYWISLAILICNSKSNQN